MDSSIEAVRMQHLTVDTVPDTPRDIPTTGATPTDVANAADASLEAVFGPFLVSMVLWGLQESDRIQKRTESYAKEMINDES